MPELQKCIIKRQEDNAKNKSTSNLVHLQQFDANGIIVHPYKLLIILHDCYTLTKPYIAILALL